MQFDRQAVARSQSGLRRRAALILAAGLCIAAAVAIWALITGSFSEVDARILASTLAASLCTLGGLVGATVLERTDFRRQLGRFTILVSAVDLAFTLALIWSSGGDSEFLSRSLGVTSALMLATAHACLVLRRLAPRESPGVTALSWTAVVFASTAALLLSGLFAFATGPIDAVVWRCLGVLAVLAVLNTLLVPIVRRIAREARQPSRLRAGS